MSASFRVQAIQEARGIFEAMGWECVRREHLIVTEQLSDLGGRFTEPERARLRIRQSVFAQLLSGQRSLFAVVERAR